MPIVMTRGPAKRPVRKTPVAKKAKPTVRPARTRRIVVGTIEAADALVAGEADTVALQAIACTKQRLAKKRGASPRRRTAVERLDDPPPASGAELIERVSRAVERELSQIEVIIGGHHVKPAQRTEAERRARTLASLARTLGEVMRLRRQDQRVKPFDDDVPRDLDEFRRELSRRLEQMVRSREAVSAGGNEAG